MASVSSPAQNAMALPLETATFEGLSLRRSGKFENVACPILLSYSSSIPYGPEISSRFIALPAFAGGDDPRKHLIVQLELSEAEAAGLQRLDEACELASTSTGTWSKLVSLTEGRYSIKARLIVTGSPPTAVRVDKIDLPAGWDRLKVALDENLQFMGHDLKIALRAAYIWNVSGKRGLALTITQLVLGAEHIQPERLDYFLG